MQYEGEMNTNYYEIANAMILSGSLFLSGWYGFKFTKKKKKNNSKFIYLEQTVKLDSSWTKILNSSINKYILYHIYTYIKITFVLYYYGYSY